MDFLFRTEGRAAYPQKHILVVEDNLAYQQRLLAHLGTLFPPEGNVQISTVSGGHAASLLLAAKKFDLIILDYDMPEGNGMDLLKWMRRAGVSVPVLIFSDDPVKQATEMRDWQASFVATKERLIQGFADIWLRFHLHGTANAVPTPPVSVTVVLTSGRPGGVDISLRGLADQTFTDFEVVFVDGLYHRRHAAVLDYVAKVGLKQPFYHVPHHRSPDNDLWGVPSAGFNTGYMLAAGNLVVMLMDYAYARPDWLYHHVRTHIGKRRLVMAPHEYRDLPPVKTKGNAPLKFFKYGGECSIQDVHAQRALFDDISIFHEPFHTGMLGQQVWKDGNDYKTHMSTGPASWGDLHTKNDSFPTDAIFAVNGMDELYDRGCGPGDIDLGRRLTQYGLEPWHCAEAGLVCLNPRSILPNMNVTMPRTSRLPPPHHERFAFSEGERYAHICADNQTLGSGNTYTLKERQRLIWKWREISQKREPAIPDIRIPDREWFHAF